MAKKNTYEYNNLTKTEKDCLALIESLGIYELRALARVFGDNSPTILKRNEHISIVMTKIIEGEDLKPIPLRQGRPYKELSNIEGILTELSQLTGKDYTLKSNQQRTVTRTLKTVTFRQAEEDIIKQRLFPIEVRGILRERNEKDFYFLNQDNGKLVLVKKDIDSRLKPNDYLVGTAVVMNEQQEYILETIKALNYQNYRTYQDFSNEYTHTMPTQKLKFENKEIVLGCRYLISGNKFLSNAEKTKKLLSLLKENKIITLALIPNVMYEDVLSINSLGFANSFLLKYEESPLSVYEALMLFIEHTSRLQQQGHSVALFVEDMTTIANGVDFAFKNNTKALMGHTEIAVESIKQLVMLAKAGGENKHTTFFTTLDDADMFDQTYVSSVYKVSKKIDL